MIKKETKSFITETAFKLFLEKGFRNTSMADLVEATQLSKGAFYHYFENKEKLYIEVIDTYFLQYYRTIDWETLQKLSINEIEEEIMKLYKSIVPEILALAQKGMARYFILFFEAYELHPTFSEEVKTFYAKLKEVIETRLLKTNTQNAGTEAVNIIAKYEGFLFWLAVFPDQTIEGLLD